MTNQYWRNELNAEAMSGSELMMLGLEENLGQEFLEPFHFTLSRLRDLPEDKIRIYWAHDMAEDPESENALANEGWQRFHKIVFVSNWQAQQFITRYNIPWSRTIVMRNAINPVECDVLEKFDFSDATRTVKISYHTTPHRGLALLVPVIEHMQNELKEANINIHVDVFSSFGIYGSAWDERNKQFQPLYDRVATNEQMTYHGFVSNEELYKHHADTHIFAYPCIWQETSCRALMESMSAGQLCIHPNYGALFETASQWTAMYPWNEDAQQHAMGFYQMLRNGIQLIVENDEGLKDKLRSQKAYADMNYSWQVRSAEWTGMLNSLRDLPRALPKKSSAKGDQVWSYTVDI